MLPSFANKCSQGKENNSVTQICGQFLENPSDHFILKKQTHRQEKPTTQNLHWNHFHSHFWTLFALCSCLRPSLLPICLKIERNSPYSVRWPHGTPNRVGCSPLLYPQSQRTSCLPQPQHLSQCVPCIILFHASSSWTQVLWGHRGWWQWLIF